MKKILLSSAYYTLYHSSEIRGLCLMKCSSQMLPNLPYFWNTKTHVVFFVFHFVLCTLFSLMNALVYVYLYSKSMENFEAFHWNFSSSINLLFLKSGTLVPFFKALGHIMNIQREGRRNLLYKTWNNPHYFNTP